MTDPEKPAFHVVDRRRSASQAEPMPSSSSSGDVPADTSSATSDLNPAASPQTPEKTEPNPASPSDNAAAAGAFELEDNESGSGETANDAMPMPDPAALLAYVGMQMDARTLAGTLLGVFAGHAWRAMGLVANPVTGKTETDLPEAQIAIDCVQFLLGKVENDLSAEERRELQCRLNDLRMNYLVQVREGRE